MSYVKGEAHKIPAMASKSCNAVSSRDLYVPLEHIIDVDTEHRTFKVTIKAYCYFGTRINIENTFHDMTIAGQAVQNTTIDGWVSGDLPGKQIASLVINGTFDAEGNPSTRDFDVSLSGQMTYYKDVGCTETKEIPFFNQVIFTIQNIEPNYTVPDTPTIEGTTSLDDALLVDLQTTSFGEGGGKFLYVEYSKTSDFSNVKQSPYISTLSGSVRISNLQRNTVYYLRPVAANNGMSATGEPEEAATLAASKIKQVYENSSIYVEGIVFNGGRADSPTTTVEYSYNKISWTTFGSPTESTTTFSVRGYLTQGKTAYLRTKTVTDAGTYISDAVEFVVPRGITGRITSITPSGSSAVVKFKVSANNMQADPVTATLYYRPYGLEEEWVKGGVISNITNSQNEYTITLNDLIPNSAIYEVSINVFQDAEETKEFTYDFADSSTTATIDWSEWDASNLMGQMEGTFEWEKRNEGNSWLILFPNHSGSGVMPPSAGGINIVGTQTIGDTMTVVRTYPREYDTPPMQFYTIPQQVHNDTCDSLDYLVQLICQTLNAIKQGNITVYMNDDTKKWCEGEDGVPTLATIMSRINRFMHTVGCILCSMEGFIALLKDSSADQVFMGELGWVDCDDEPTADSVNPVLSGAVYDAVEELVKQVWHYMGDYDFFARNQLELNAQSGTEEGQTAVLGDQVYTWNGSSWVSARDIPHEDFGVIHINHGKYEDQAFYWFVNDWNRLDADTEEIEARLDALEALTVVHSFDNSDYLINIQPYGLSDSDYATIVPTDATRETIIILTQDIPANDYVEIITAESSGNYDIGGN